MRLGLGLCLPDGWSLTLRVWLGTVASTSFWGNFLRLLDRMTLLSHLPDGGVTRFLKWKACQGGNLHLDWGYWWIFLNVLGLGQCLMV